MLNFVSGIEAVLLVYGSARGSLLILVMKVREAIALLEKNSWTMVRQKGSHRHFRKAGNPNVVTVPGNLGERIPAGTLNNILKKAGLK